MSAPTEEELVQINELKEHPLIKEVSLTSKQQDPYFLMRWIRARDHDVDKAAELLSNSIRWRATNLISDLLNVPTLQFMLEKYPRKLEGHDKQGRPVFSAQFGRWDVPFTVALEENTAAFREYTWQGIEQLMEAMENADEKRKQVTKGEERITQCVVIVDMAGFSFMSLLNVYAVQNGLTLLAEYEANYPETLHSCYLINSSSSINMLLNLVKGTLAQKTYDKIKVFGCDQAEWAASLCEAIDKSELPIEYGGTKVILDEDDEVEEAVEAGDGFDDDDDEFVEAVEHLDIL